ncbi:hypothetical protein CsSME_00027909 [Camellia sinensis var. sinensis]
MRFWSGNLFFGDNVLELIGLRMGTVILRFFIPRPPNVIRRRKLLVLWIIMAFGRRINEWWRTVL